MRQGLLLAFTSLFAATPRGLPAQNAPLAAPSQSGRLGVQMPNPPYLRWCPAVC